MRNSISYLSAFALLSGGVLFTTILPAELPAKDVSESSATLQISLPSTLKPERISALVLDANGVSSRTPTNVRSDAASITASIPRSSDDTSTMRFVALALQYQNDSGALERTTWSRVTSLDPKRVDPASLKLCKPKPVDVMTIAQQQATLERIIEVRRKLQQTYRAQLSTTISGQLLERIQNLEERLGTAGQQPLTADRPAREIQSRLYRVLVAARAIKEQSAKKK